MHKAIKIIGLCSIVFALLTGPAVDAARTIDNIKFPPLHTIEIPDIEKIPLANGITLYILEDHELPVVRANVFLAAGSFLDPADKIGLGEITGDVMRTGGTARMSGDEIDEALEAIGASIEVNIGTTSGTAGMNILSEYSDTGLEILADILRNPQFNQDKIDLAKNRKRTEISSRNDEPFSVCIREFKKIIYGADSPYARQTEYATVNSITREDLIDFHNKYISPENVMIAVWGDFDKAEMTAKIKKYFGDWPKGAGKVPKLPEVNYEFKPGVHYIEKENITQSNILIGHIGGLTGDPDFFALTVANNVLGGSFGSRMFNEVRSKKGLAYSTGGMFTTNIAFPGIYYNYVITKLESTAEAIKAVMTEIRRMQTDPPTEEELQRAKSSYLNSFVFNFDSKGEIINRMMTYDYYDFPQDFLYTVKENIEKVTAADVIDVAKRRFHPDEMHIVVVGIQDQFDQPLSTFGRVDQIDISIPSGEVAEEVVVNEESLARGLELLKAAAGACGGIESFKKVTSISSKSDIALVLPQGKISISATSYNVFPDKSKEIVNTPMGEIVTVTDGETGWMQQAGNTMDMTSEQVAESKEDEFRNTMRIFQDLENPQFKAVFVKSEDFNGRPADIVKISSLDDAMSFKLILDSETHLPVGKMFFGNTIMGPGNLTHIISDYRDISGLKIPFSIIIESDGKATAEITLSELKINPAIPEDTFKRP
ncbi:MAG: hypothetical protein CVT49_06250 [candidate division Zixibacteria bacterium HGW-Zixibacteria-1]|nr:MAG: hypothetical protein CVT49_06250 [candidate division Zixibacteria bacterium HGW-Zixibacteria-1]